MNLWGFPFVLLGLLGVVAGVLAIRDSEYNIPIAVFPIGCGSVMMGIGVLVTFPGLIRALFL